MEWLKTFGCYPPEYNRAIHGPYNPGTYYGKKDTPLGEVKMNELPAWLKRRSYSPFAMGAAVSRFMYRINYKYAMPLRAKSTAAWMVCAMVATWNFLINYKTIRHHYTVKYHW